MHRLARAMFSGFSLQRCDCCRGRITNDEEVILLCKLNCKGLLRGSLDYFRLMVGAFLWRDRKKPRKFSERTKPRLRFE